MSAIVRETYYQALFALLNGKLQGTFAVIGRRPKPMEEHGDAECPALYLLLGEKHSVKNEYRQKPKRSLAPQILLVAAQPDPNAPIGPVMNAIIDAVEAAITPSDAYVTQNLGGLVHSAMINGEIETYELIDGTRASALIPIEIVIP